MTSNDFDSTSLHASSQRRLQRKALQSIIPVVSHGGLSLAILLSGTLTPVSAGNTKTRAEAGRSVDNSDGWVLLKPADRTRYVRIARGAATTFQIINNSGMPLSIFWLDAQGTKQHYTDVSAGESKNLGTYAKQTWEIADGTGSQHGLVFAGATPRAVEITTDGARFTKLAGTTGTASLATTSSSSPSPNSGGAGNTASAASFAGSKQNGSPASIASATTGTSESGLPSATAVPTDLGSLPDEDSFPFRKTASGHLIVNAELNGRPIEMNACNAGGNHLKAAGIDPSTLKGRMQKVGGSTGGVVNCIVVPMKLKLGKTTRTVDIWVQPSSPTPPLVGQNFLAGLQYEVNNQLQVIKIKKSTNTSGKTLTEKYDPRDRNSVPFTMSGQSIIVPVDVCGKQIPMIFDTGAHAIVFPLRIWSEMHLQGKLLGYSTATGIDGSSRSAVFVVDRVEIGPVALKDVRVFVSNPGPTLPLLGQSVLGEEKFIIDNSKSIIHFHR